MYVFAFYTLFYALILSRLANFWLAPDLERTAMKELNRKKEKKPLTVFTNDGSVAGSEEEQVKSITAHFMKMFTQEIKDNIEPIPPSKMKTPFTQDEIMKAAKSMRTVL